jgi:argininosuccinate lyase
VSSPTASGQPLWHGRFGEGPADELLAFTVSLPFDQRLAVDDLAGSRAHVSMLEQVGLLTAEERSVIHAALDRVGAELADGSFAFAPTDEDIHTAIERRVTEIAGGTGAKLHTGRSRNDQVALDLRLYVRREGYDQIARIHALQQVLLQRANDTTEVALPGYTHLQRAQPVLLAHHLLAHFWAFARDVDRWRDCLVRVDVSPLGAGALAGSSLPLDPNYVAGELGFPRRFQNSLDAVSDRDFVAEALFVATLTQLHLSRIGEEIVLWSTDEFGFVRLSDAYSTGSSMLPQKKNPDIAELARGKAGRIIGDLTGFLATMKGLPLSYNRDYQEDKEPLFDAMDQVRLGLGAITGMIATATFDIVRMQSAADSESGSATDLAEWLVQRGVPFREAHAIVGALVRESLAGSASLRDLVHAHPRLGPDAAQLIAPGVAVRRRTTAGGAGPAPVADQRKRFEAALAAWSAWAGGADITTS